MLRCQSPNQSIETTRHHDAIITQQSSELLALTYQIHSWSIIISSIQTSISIIINQLQLFLLQEVSRRSIKSIQPIYLKLLVFHHLRNHETPNRYYNMPSFPDVALHLNVIIKSNYEISPLPPRVSTPPAPLPLSTLRHHPN